MAIQREPLIVPLAGVIAGIGASRCFEIPLIELYWALLILVFLQAVARHKAPRLRSLLTLLVCATIGSITAEIHRPATEPDLDADDDELLLVSGCVVDPPSLATAAARFAVEIESGARIRISLTAREGEALPDLRYGQLVEIETKVRKPRNFQNPGSFDFRDYLARQQVYWTGTARGVEKLKVLPGTCGSSWAAIWHRLRRLSLDRLVGLYPNDPYTVAMMAGMLVGDESAIQRSWTDAFRRTGTYHALVISGLHITIISGGVLFLLRLCWIPFGPRLLLAVLLAWSYALLAGMQPPVARAAAGFTLFLIASYFYRRGRVLNLLAAVAITFLLWDPGQLFDASFQLSFLAVAAIGGLAMPLMERTTDVLRSALRSIDDTHRDPALPANVGSARVELRLIIETLSLCTRIGSRRCTAIVSGCIGLGRSIFDSLAVSLCVQIALLLPSVAYFHRLSITSLSANVIAVPALSAAVPFGLLAILTSWTWPAIAAESLLQFARWIVELHAALEPVWRLPETPAWLAAAFLTSLVVTAVSLRASCPRLRLVSVAALLACGTTILVHPFAALTSPGELELTAIDVGQGDGLLVVFPNSQTMLVDAGGIPSFDPRIKPKLEIGEDVVSSYLWSRGFQRIDVVAMTHGHDDHARGLLAILENFHPRELWTGAQPRSGTWLELQRKARDLGVRIVQRRRGDRAELAGTQVEVLAPGEDYVPVTAAKNNDSLVMQLRYGKHRFLLTGDMERQIESDLVYSHAGTESLHADVLKVAHHGSKSSSTPDFLNVVRPAFALISAGKYNSYHHPSSDVLDRFSELHTRVLRTDQDGLITIRSDGKRLEVSTFKDSVEHSSLRAAFGID